MQNISIFQIEHTVKEYVGGRFHNRTLYMSLPTLEELLIRLNPAMFKQFTEDNSICTTPEGQEFLVAFGADAKHILSRKVSLRSIVIYKDNMPPTEVQRIREFNWGKNEITWTTYPDNQTHTIPNGPHILSIKEIKETWFHRITPNGDAIVEEIYLENPEMDAHGLFKKAMLAYPDSNPIEIQQKFKDKLKYI